MDVHFAKESELAKIGTKPKKKEQNSRKKVQNSQGSRLRRGALGGHTTFRILSLLRYAVDVGKSSPNPIFFLNPMKTDQREATQSSKF